MSKRTQSNEDFEQSEDEVSSPQDSPKKSKRKTKKQKDKSPDGKHRGRYTKEEEEEMIVLFSMKPEFKAGTLGDEVCIYLVACQFVNLCSGAYIFR